MTTIQRRQQMAKGELFASAGITVSILTGIALGVVMLQQLPSPVDVKKIQPVAEEEDIRPRLDAMEMRIERIESKLIGGTETQAEQARLKGR
jgi:hypothetical protein